MRFLFFLMCETWIKFYAISLLHLLKTVTDLFAGCSDIFSCYDIFVYFLWTLSVLLYFSRCSFYQSLSVTFQWICKCAVGRHIHQVGRQIGDVLYCHVYESLWAGFGLVIGFIKLLQLVTTYMSYVFAFYTLHTSL
jgi:hypothetical protein